MSEKKRIWRLKRSDAANQGDIRYRGPISYRAFVFLGWICILLSVAAAILPMLKSMGPKVEEAGQGPVLQYLPYVARMSAILLLIAGISRIMRDRREYSQHLLTYLGLAVIIAAGAALIFQRTVLAAVDKLFLQPEQVLPMVEEAFSKRSQNGFIVFNVFIDIFLCILMFFFVNVQPKRIFTGKWVLIPRACAALPFVYAVVCMCLKYQAVCKKTVLPFWCFPIMTVKPVPIYGLFLFLAIYVKRKEIRFCQDGRSIEEYQASMLSRRNSLRFGVILAIAMAVAGIVDYLLVFGASRILLKPLAPADGDALTWSMQAAKSIGFGGDSLILLIAAPFMLLYSFNRVPRWRIISILAPLLAILLIVLLTRGTGDKSTSTYIVENKIPKINVFRVKEIMTDIEKTLDVIGSLFTA